MSSITTPDVDQHQDWSDPSIVEALNFAIEQARKDPVAFAEFVLTDDEGEPLEVPDFQRAWYDLLLTERYISIWAAVEHGKTTVLETYILWRLGTNPNLLIMVASKNETQAKKIIGKLKRLIGGDDDVSKRLHMVFPNLVPSSNPEDVWSALAFTVERSNKQLRDHSVQAFGLGGNPTGARCNLAVLDDLLTLDSTLTETGRKDAITFVKSKVISRMKKSGQVVSIGTPFHPEDFLHWVEAEGHKKKRWKTFKFPAIDPDTWDPSTILWPGPWDLERLQERRDILNDDEEFARQMLCRARDDSAALFKREHIAAACNQGLDFELVYALPPGHVLDDGYYIFTGVDLAVSKGKKSHFSAIFTILLTPDGHRRVLYAEHGRWSAPEILERVEGVYLRYRGDILVEDNAAQAFLVQLMRDGIAKAAVMPFTTTNNKKNPHFGVESISGQMAKGMWIIPPYDNNPTIAKWIQDLLFYKRGSHVGDVMMASWFASVAAYHKHSASLGEGGGVNCVKVREPTKKRDIMSLAESGQLFC